jgi:hypothetical protein
MNNLPHHPFFRKSESQQKRFLLRLALLFIGFILLTGVLGYYTGWYLIPVLSITLGLSLIAPFFDIPALQKKGDLKYYSLLFLAEKPKNQSIKIHAGSLFDYYFVLDRSSTPQQRKAFIMEQFLSGLLNFIEAQQTHKHLKVRGTSYIINARTAEKIGFKPQKTDALQLLILSYNYFNLVVANSLAKGKLSFPKLNRTISFEADISALNERKTSIQNLRDRLKRSQKA